MKKLRTIIGGSVLSAVVGMALSANALTITPASPSLMTGLQTSESAINTAILAVYPNLLIAYKQDVGAGSDSGPYASSYSTAFFNTPNDPQDATISYVSGSSIPGSPLAKYLLIKDGKQDPAWYLFDITPWNGTDAIVMTGFWPGQGAISHVSIYTGEPGGDIPGTPDGGTTLLLLGAAMAGFAALRRKLA